MANENNNEMLVESAMNCSTHSCKPTDRSHLSLCQNTRPVFTLADALGIQSQHVAEWQTILSDEAYAALLCKVRDENAKGYSDPFAVFRGQSITEFLANLARTLNSVQGAK